MARLQQVLCEEIRRQAHKEICSLIKDMKDQIADLRKIIQVCNLRLRQIEKNQPDISTVFPSQNPCSKPDEKNKNVRVTPELIKKWRIKFGLSQGEYAALLGVNILSVNHWESGKTVPREEQKQKIIRLRSLGKRDLARLMEEKHIPPKRRSARKDASGHHVRRIHLSTKIAS